jgi:hypothetical protein
VADTYPQETRPRRRWGRRLLITLIVLLVLLGIGLFVVDRFGASFAERKIAERVAQEVANNGATSAEPDVTIGGVPFVTQVLDGNYKEITILLRDFSGAAGNGKTVKLPLLDIRAKDVRAPLDTIRSGNGKIIATTVTGAGTLDYASLAGLIDRKGIVLGESGGKLTVKGPVEALGRTFDVSGTANLTVKDNVVQVRFAEVTAEGLAGIPLVQNLLNSYAKDISIDLKLPALPLQLAVQKVEPRPEGLVVTATADEVPLNSGGL